MNVNLSVLVAFKKKILTWQSHCYHTLEPISVLDIVSIDMSIQ